MKKVICLVVVLLMMLSVLTGCGVSKKPEGKYYSEKLGFYIVFEEKTIKFYYPTGATNEFGYIIDGDEIKIIYSTTSKTVPFDCDDNTVTIDGDKFVRVE